jgi:MOSC domain-containing protein YiiM
MQEGNGSSKDPSLSTVGTTGFIAAPIVVGGDPVKIWEKLYHTIEGIKIPQVQYRTDCNKSSLKKLATLKTQGWV